MTRPLVGRDPELAEVLHAAASGDAWTVVVGGVAGIGKSALWEAAQAELAPRWMLRTRSRAAETELAFVGLTDLLDVVPDAVLDELPGPQRDALAAATLRAALGDGAPDPRAVGTALRTLLLRLATDGPVVLALDDVQWLDPASCAALEFAVHRCPVGVLVAVRDPGRTVPVASAGQVEETRVILGPLSVAALHHLVVGALGNALPRPALVRVAETSGGHPLFALELARVLSDAGTAAGDLLPRLPASLTAALAERVGRLTPPARRSVLAVALAAQPTVALLRAVDARAGLEEAEEARLVVVAGGRVDLEHPLVGPAVVELASVPDVRALHRSLAGVLSDDERCARHLALAAVEPDPSVADALDTAVAATRARGALAAAAELARLALQHSVGAPVEAVQRRTLTLAGIAFEEGDAAEAERLLRTVYDSDGPAEQRATAALELAEILWKRDEITQCVEVARAAVAAGAGPELTARAHLTLMLLWDDREANTRRAIEVLDEAGVTDPQLRSWAEFALLDIEFGAGRGLDVPALEAALAAERTGRDWRSDDQVATCRPALLKYADHLVAARSSLDELRARAEVEGNVGQLIYVVGHYPVLLLRMGDLAAADAAAREHFELASTTGQTSQLWQARFNLTCVALHAGRLSAAAELVAALPGVLQADSHAQRAYRAVAGSLALLQGAPVVAVGHLDEWWRLSQERGDDPGISRAHADYADALVALERYDDCAVFLDAAAAAADRAGRVSVAALVARGRAILAAALGDLDGALAAVTDAVRLDVEVPIALEGARHRLLEGQLRRRRKEKLRAREALVAALADFEAVGAAWWADRARAELARVNIRPSAPTELTASERRIAELAASGLTTREIAEAAFVSPKTVEANLTRVYRKLGIGSRAELGQRWTDLHVEGSP